MDKPISSRTGKTCCYIVWCTDRKHDDNEGCEVKGVIGVNRETLKFVLICGDWFSLHCVASDLYKCFRP